MNDLNFQFIDSHIHLDHVHKTNPDNILRMKQNRCLPISWAFSNHAKSRTDIQRYLNNLADMTHDLNQSDFACFFLAGIHPRNITQDLKPENIQTLLSPFMEHPFCLGIGEIGLETENAQEQEIFLAQIEYGLSVSDKGMRIGIHTPRSRKQEITAKTLSLLEPFKDIEKVTVIDHCSSETIRAVLEKGFYAGVTLSSIKTSLEELKDMVSYNRLYLNRIICNTDSGNIFYDDLYNFVMSDSFSKDVKNNLARNNALDFFTIKETP